MTRRSAKDLLPDLPDDEPWFELKFQLWELDWDLRGIIARIEEWKTRLGEKEQARKLAGAVSQLYFDVDHDAQAHAPRAVQLAGCLLWCSSVCWRRLHAAAVFYRSGLGRMRRRPPVEPTLLAADGSDGRCRA
jgi:hypothetical protein